MLICRMGTTHEIHRIVGGEGDTILWTCPCPRGTPGTDGYPCTALRTFWDTMKRDNRPPSKAVFTPEGAQIAVQSCACLKKKGRDLVFEQIRTTPPAPPPPPAEPSRNAPCPCGSRLKFKQCHAPCTCGSGKPARECHEAERAARFPVPAQPPQPPAHEETEEREEREQGEKERAKRQRAIERKEREYAEHRKADTILEWAHAIDDLRREADRETRQARKLERSGAGTAEALELRRRAKARRDVAKKLQKAGPKPLT